MILDASAILAVVFAEDERDEFLHKIGTAPVVGVGAPTLVETVLVLGRRVGDDAGRHVEGFVERASLVVVPFERPHSHAAAQAWLRFGRGRHPAALNVGDCLAYATARVADRPLLCKGDDFARTDLRLA